MNPDDVYDYAVLFDTVTETAFGPLTSERDVPDGDLWGALDRFCEYVRGADMRGMRHIPDGELSRLHGCWLAREKGAMTEDTRIESIEEAAEIVGHKYARKLAAVYGLELDSDGKIVDEEVGPEEEESAAGLELLKAAKPCSTRPLGLLSAGNCYVWHNRHGAQIYVADNVGICVDTGWSCYVLTKGGALLHVASSGPGHKHWDKDKALLWSYVMAAEVRPDGTWPNPMERKP